MLNIIDDFVKLRVQDQIENLLLKGEFPYFYGTESVNMNSNDTIMESDNTLNVPQFYHMFVYDGRIISQQYGAITPISNKLADIIDDDCYMHRCKVNLNTIDGRFENKYHTPHVDNIVEDQITAIYYVNDSDGDTLFFNKEGKITERVTPKKGRLVWWKGIYFHAKTSPIKNANRVVLNFNLLPFRTKNVT